jgi:hypothetical protein
VAEVDRKELVRVSELALFLGYTADGVDSEAADPSGPVVTGTQLAVRHRACPVDLSPDGDRAMSLAELGVEELAARLARTEAALARARSRRAVRAADAVRRVQHGRSVADLRAAWRLLRGGSER